MHIAITYNKPKTKEWDFNVLPQLQITKYFDNYYILFAWLLWAVEIDIWNWKEGNK